MRRGVLLLILITALTVVSVAHTIAQSRVTYGFRDYKTNKPTPYFYTEVERFTIFDGKVIELPKFNKMNRVDAEGNFIYN